MKKIVTILAFFATGTIFAQSITDALRYGSTNVTGTARYRAMGGAFGALGGDLSAVGDNPAASAVFTKGTASFTLASDSFDSETTYFGNTTAVSDTDLSVNQVGGVFIIEGAPNSRWNKISLGFNYDRTGQFDDNFVANGVNQFSI